MSIKSYTSVAAGNISLFPENMAPSAVNDGMRQVQADIRSWYLDAEWIDRNDPGISRASASSFKITGDVTEIYHAGRRLKLYDATTLYGDIASSSYSAPDTTINVTTDSGSLTASLTSVAVGIQSVTNRSFITEMPTVTVSGAAQFKSTVTASGAAVFKTTATIEGAATISGAAVFKTTATVEGATTLSGAAVAKTTLTVEGAATISGAATFASTVSVSGAAVFKTSLDVNGTLSASATANFKVTPLINGSALSTLTIQNGSGSGDYTTTSTSYGDVDGTNLAYTVTVPNGYKLLINVSCGVYNNTDLANVSLALADGTTVLVENRMDSPNANSCVFPASLTHIFTGDGASHTFKLRFKTLTGGSTAAITNSSATMRPTMTFLLQPSA